MKLPTFKIGLRPSVETLASDFLEDDVEGISPTSLDPEKVVGEEIQLIDTGASAPVEDRIDQIAKAFSSIAHDYEREARVVLDDVRDEVVTARSNLMKAYGQISERTEASVRNTITAQCLKGGIVQLYVITDDAYQGGFTTSDCGSPQLGKTVELWLGGKQNPNSSVYPGIRNVLRAVEAIPSQHPAAVISIHLFTDGIENQPTVNGVKGLSLYGQSLPLSPAIVGALDFSFQIGSSRELANMDVTVHPEDVKIANQAMEDYVLPNYLVKRLESARAQVTLAPY
jgi:hypothetical protein